MYLEGLAKVSNRHPPHQGRGDTHPYTPLKRGYPSPLVGEGKGEGDNGLLQEAHLNKLKSYN